MNLQDDLMEMEGIKSEMDSQNTTEPGDYDGQTQGQPLSDFLMQLEDYSPTVSLIFFCKWYFVTFCLFYRFLTL